MDDTLYDSAIITKQEHVMKRTLLRITMVVVFIVAGMFGVKLLMAQSSEPQPNGVVCKYGLLWGDGCSSANYGNSCAPDNATLCSEHKQNCEENQN